ncbi:MAG: PadR family transcriptional regulator [Candidatus Bathyarchaeia archaeon]
MLNHKDLHGFAKRNWMRHTAAVPKGFIRYHVLEALSQKPMSGSELIESIEKHTGGFWKPSPGSIYPLLSWLQEKGFVKELPSENGLKRYELTANGKVFFEEQKNMRRRFREQAGFAPGAFFDNFLTKIPPEKTVEIREAMKRLAISFFHLGATLQDKYSSEAVEESLKVVSETAAKLEEIDRKLKGEKKNE